MQLTTVDLFDRQVIDTSKMTEDQFRAFRSDKVGGSDLSAICGANPFKSPYSLYLEKRGEVEVKLNAAMQDGHIYEPHLLAEWSRRHPDLRLIQKLCLVHPDRPYMIANLDGLAVNGSIQVVVESKKAGDRSIKMYGLPGGEQIPQTHYIQVTSYMGIVKRLWGAEVPCDVIVKDPQKMIEDSPIYRVNFDQDFFEALESYAEEFHHNLTHGIPPDVDGLKQTEDYLRRMYAKDAGTAKEADQVTAMAVEVLKDLKARIGSLEEEEQKAKNRIINFLKADSFLTVNGVPVVTYKATKDGIQTDWKAICAHLGVDEGVIREFTQTKPGSRRFLVV